MPLIHALFYTPNPKDHITNHLVTRFDAPFSHCDVQFEDGMASSVYQGETVYWKHRGFKKPGYTRVTMSVDQAGYNKAYQLCKDRSERKMKFDAWGMYMLPLTRSADRQDYTFCSKHCTEILQVAGVRNAMGLDPNSMTPSALRRALGRTILHTDRIDLKIAV